MKYKRIYEMLKKEGHTPVKALDILVDAQRKPGVFRKNAREWIFLLWRFRHYPVKVTR